MSTAVPHTPDHEFDSEPAVTAVTNGGARRKAATSRSRGTNGYLGRERLVLAAADLADRDGWLNLNLSRVAKAVDRHVTSLYSHVAGLDDLRREITMLALEELGLAMWQAALGRSGEDALVSLGTVYREYALEHPGRTEAMATYQDPNDDEMTKLRQHLAEPILATLRSMGLTEAQVPHAHRVFIATLRGFSITENSDLYGPVADVNETFRQMLLLFTRALGSGAWPALES